jgi:PAS domain S-box-containing protein
VEREIFRKNLKRLREQNNLTQRELSEKCNYDPTYVGKIERGAKDPSIESVIRLANALNVPAVELFEDRASFDNLQEQFNDEPPENLTAIYQGLFKNLQTNVGLVDSEGTILDANQGLLEFNGIDEDELREHTVETLPMWSTDQRTPEWFSSMIEEAFEGKVLSRETQLQDHSGTTIRMQCFAYSVDVEPLQKMFVAVEFIPLKPGLNRTKIISE